MTYVLNKALDLRKKDEPELYAPGDSCTCKCATDCSKKVCPDCKKTQDICTVHTKNEAYELLTTGMIGGPSIVFCRYAEVGVSKIRSHRYQDANVCKAIHGYDANSLYLFCSGQEMPCGKEKLRRSKNPENPKVIKNITEKVLNDKLLGFFQVDIEVPEQLHDHFSEFSSLFVLGEVPETQIPEHMKEYKIATGRKTIKGGKKLLGVLRAKKILLYSPLLKWYLNHGLLVTKIYKYLSYRASRPFKWFPEEVSNARRQADEDPDKKQLGDTAKLKGNIFYGKMIENLLRHVRTMFSNDEKTINAAFRSPFFNDFEEIGDAYEVCLKKRQINITRPYQCGISAYQLAKLRILEFYYDFLDKFIDRRDFEFLQMNTDSFYFAMSANDLDDIIRPELRDLYAKEKSKWLVTDKYSKRVPGLET